MTRTLPGGDRPGGHGHRVLRRPGAAPAAAALAVALLGLAAPGAVGAASRDELRLVRVEPARGELSGMRSPGDRMVVGENAIRATLRYRLASAPRAKVQLYLYIEVRDHRVPRYASVDGGWVVTRGEGTARPTLSIQCMPASPAVLRATRLAYRLLELGPGDRVVRRLAEGRIPVDLRFRCPGRRAAGAGRAGGAGGMAGLAGGLGAFDVTGALEGRRGQDPGAKGHSGGTPGAAPGRRGSSALPDLVVRIAGAPSMARPGEDVGRGMKLIVRNRGGGVARGTVPRGRGGYMIDLVLSRDRRVPRGFATWSERFREDVLLRGGRASRTEDLPPGAARSYPVGAGIPADTPPGRYHLCATVDPGDRVRESDERNNTACVPIRIARAPGGGRGRPDLVITRLERTRWGPCEPRRPVMVFRVTLANRGTAPTPAIPDKALVQVRDQDGRGWSNGVPVPPIPPGGSRTVEVPVYYLKDDPAHMTERAPHPFQAVADPLGLVAELDEGNNRSRVIQVDPRRICQAPPQAQRRVTLELVRVKVIKDGDPHRSSAPGEWTLRAGLRARSGARSERFVRQVNDGEVWRIGHRYPPLAVRPGEPLTVFVHVDESDGPTGITRVRASRRLAPGEWRRLLGSGRTFEVPFSGRPDYESVGGGPVEGVAVFRLVR